MHTTPGSTKTDLGHVVQPLVSPWAGAFEEFAQSITRSALLVSPFIIAEPLERLTSAIDRDRAPQIEILTNLAVDNLVQRSTDPGALALFCRTIPTVRVRHLPGLHAKVYIADDIVAIVTSANLTGAGLNQNYEYGIKIRDSSLILQISQDLKGYGDLGTEVSLLDLDHLAAISEDLHEQQSRVLGSARRALRQEFEKRVEAGREALRHLWAKPGESTNAIFSQTILYLLRNGPLTTEQIHPLVQHIHPELCDDSIDRIINEVHFGKRWKHMVRNAQQSLKNQGLITFENGKWRLV
jgi:hypothetical protein